MLLYLMVFITFIQFIYNTYTFIYISYAGYSNSPANKSLELLSRKLQRSNMFRSVFFIRAAKVDLLYYCKKKSLIGFLGPNYKNTKQIFSHVRIMTIIFA